MNITEQNENLLRTYGRVTKMHSDLVMLLDSVQQHARTDLNPGAVVDAVFILKKIEQFLESTRKEVTKALEMTQKVGCLLAMQSNNSIRGEIANGYGESSQKMLIPDREKEPQQYAALMKALGAPMLDTIRPSFSGVEAFVTGLAAEGKPMPAGLEHCRTIPKFTIRARANSGIDIDSIASYIERDVDGPTHNDIPF